MQFIRADANESNASGHVMRCIAIAGCLRQLGETVIFITADSYPVLLLKENGFETIVLDSDWRDMEAEIPALKEAVCKAINKYGCKNTHPGLLVDSYQVTPAYFERVSEFATVTYIDDGTQCTYDVAGLIAYSHFYGEYGYEQRYAKKNTRLLLGCDYIPLRSEFADKNKKIVSQKLSKVMVTTGGADMLHCSVQIAQTLCKDYPWVTFYFIIGRFYDEKLKRELKEMKTPNMVLIENANMGQVMEECDAAVSAGGTTLYELCACGLPTVCFYVAENQQRGVTSFGQTGVMLSCGYAGEKDEFLQNLAFNFKEIESEEIRKKLSARMQGLVDGCGAMRIARALKEISENFEKYVDELRLV